MNILLADQKIILEYLFCANIIATNHIIINLSIILFFLISSQYNNN
jgi:hypothetical protein